MNINEHTGKEMRTGHCSKEYAEGWERIFGKKKDVPKNDGCRQPYGCVFPECGCPVEENK